MYKKALSDQAQSCSDQGNQYPFCSPLSTDVWTNGSTYDFVWNFKYVKHTNIHYIVIYLLPFVSYPFYVGYVRKK